MKKFLGILVLGLLFFNNVNAEERESELNNLFKQLKNSEATKAIGEGLFGNANYIDPEVGFNFCVIENGANFEVQAVYKADTTCMLKLDDSSVVDDTGC